MNKTLIAVIGLFILGVLLLFLSLNIFIHLTNFFYIPYLIFSIFSVGLGIVYIIAGIFIIKRKKITAPISLFIAGIIYILLFFLYLQSFEMIIPVITSVVIASMILLEKYKQNGLHEISIGILFVIIMIIIIISISLLSKFADTYETASLFGGISEYEQSELFNITTSIITFLSSGILYLISVFLLIKRRRNFYIPLIISNTVLIISLFSYNLIIAITGFLLVLSVSIVLLKQFYIIRTRNVIRNIIVFGLLVFVLIYIDSLTVPLHKEIVIKTIERPQIQKLNTELTSLIESEFKNQENDILSKIENKINVSFNGYANIPPENQIQFTRNRFNEFKLTNEYIKEDPILSVFSDMNRFEIFKMNNLYFSRSENRMDDNMYYTLNNAFMSAMNGIQNTLLYITLTKSCNANESNCTKIFIKNIRKLNTILEKNITALKSKQINESLAQCPIYREFVWFKNMEKDMTKYYMEDETNDVNKMLGLLSLWSVKNCATYGEYVSAEHSQEICILPESINTNIISAAHSFAGAGILATCLTTSTRNKIEELYGYV